MARKPSLRRRLLLLVSLPLLAVLGWLREAGELRI